MQYYVVTFTHTKIVGWAIYLHAHVSYLKKLLAEEKTADFRPGRRDSGPQRAACLQGNRP